MASQMIENKLKILNLLGLRKIQSLEFPMNFYSLQLVSLIF